MAQDREKPPKERSASVVPSVPKEEPAPGKLKDSPSVVKRLWPWFLLCIAITAAVLVVPRFWQSSGHRVGSAPIFHPDLDAFDGWTRVEGHRVHVDSKRQSWTEVWFRDLRPGDVLVTRAGPEKSLHVPWFRKDIGSSTKGTSVNADGYIWATIKGVAGDPTNCVRADEFLLKDAPYASLIGCLGDTVTYAGVEGFRQKIKGKVGPFFLGRYQAFTVKRAAKVLAFKINFPQIPGTFLDERIYGGFDITIEQKRRR